MNATVLFNDTSIMYQPTKESDVLSTLNSGDVVAILEKTNLLWWKVAHNEYTGYIYTKYLASENVNEIGDVMISMPRDCALALFKALEFALK